MYGGFNSQERAVLGNSSLKTPQAAMNGGLHESDQRFITPKNLQFIQSYAGHRLQRSSPKKRFAKSGSRDSIRRPPNK